jgi:hypothetical protein
MRVSGIIHQQICQLKWHLLASLGLIMVLPIEEAIVNLRAGDGFHSISMIYTVIAFGPLLTGLIACANVQGDLNEKRYIFWRSKPANVKRLMALKFFIGLIVSLAVIAFPLVFGFLSSTLCGEDLVSKDLVGKDLKYFVPIPSVLAVMTYSLCFGCNVLVRNTARSWLIGMLLAVFVLVIPFMLPLGYKDIISDIDFATFGLYPAIILIASAAAFVFALYATQYDCHLKTNLRGLLWVGTGLVFLLLMLFSSQVANIRVIGDKEIKVSHWVQQVKLDRIGNRIVFQGLNYVDVDKTSISINTVGPNHLSLAIPPIYGNVGFDSEGRRIIYGPKAKDCSETSYPRYPNALYMSTDDGTYYFGIISYFRREAEGSQARYFTAETYLRSYKYVENSWNVVDELDLSDCLTGSTPIARMALRLINKTLVVLIDSSCVVVDVTEPGDLKQIEKKINVIRVGHWSARYMDSQTECDIPIIPIEGISVEEKIRLSIDLLMHRFNDDDNNIYKSSIVDIHNGKIAFFIASQENVARFDVTSWDDEKVYCRFSAARPFTILEGMAGTPGSKDRIFVKDQKLYCYEDEQLMVFDVSSDHRIRKLGHLVRMDWNIEDIAVLEDGKLLLSAHWDTPDGWGRFRKRRYLYLLENPE